jgi:bacterioferritin-associated ferredoxin
MKTRVLKDIGAYLKASKRVAKHIYELAYCKAVSDKAVPKRERMCEMSDLMEHFQFLIVADDCGEEQICEPAALSALSSFTAINQHYTYTLVTKDDCKDTMGNDEGVSESVVEMLVEDTEEQPCFVQINSD